MFAFPWTTDEYEIRPGNWYSGAPRCGLFQGCLQEAGGSFTHGGGVPHGEGDVSWSQEDMDLNPILIMC